ncbi:MAG: tail fiber domain-containing protein [Acetobacteraceae bacterium]
MPTDDSAAPPAPLNEEDRREFLRLAGRLAVAAPTTALLLQAATKPARASSYGPITTTAAPTTTEGFPSDRRLKTDIARLGTLPNGLGLYAYSYRFAPDRYVGVMADEVEALLPAAVSLHRSGYKMVNYAMVLA